MEIRFFETGCPFGSFDGCGKEELLAKYTSFYVPRKGELVGLDEYPSSYRVVDVSYWFDTDEEEAMVDVLLVNSEIFQDEITTYTCDEDFE
jgi:hypothetical protein